MRKIDLSGPRKVKGESDSGPISRREGRQVVAREKKRNRRLLIKSSLRLALERIENFPLGRKICEDGSERDERKGEEMESQGVIGYRRH